MKIEIPSQIAPSIRAAVASILDSDPGLSAAHRLAVLLACDTAPGSTSTTTTDQEMPARQAAQILGKSLSTIIRWMDEGKLKGRKIGKRLTVVSCASVEALRTKSAPPPVAPLPNRLAHLENRIPAPKAQCKATTIPLRAKNGTPHPFSH